MDKGKTIFLSGATGNSYVFTVYSWGSPLVSFGAVYSVLRRGKHGYSVIYIGSSENLSLHLKTHPSLMAFTEEGMTHIGVHIEPVISLRHKKEMDLIANFSPVLNLE